MLTSTVATCDDRMHSSNAASGNTRHPLALETPGGGSFSQTDHENVTTRSSGMSRILFSAHTFVLEDDSGDKQRF